MADLPPAAGRNEETLSGEPGGEAEAEGGGQGLP